MRPATVAVLVALALCLVAVSAQDDDKAPNGCGKGCDCKSMFRAAVVARCCICLQATSIISTVRQALVSL
jgi:hypothetical protein